MLKHEVKVELINSQPLKEIIEKVYTKRFMDLEVRKIYPSG